MNNYERIIAAIKHLDTDKVPMWFMGFFDESVMEKLLPKECIGDDTKSITARQEYLENCVVSIGKRANLNFGHGSPGEFLFKVTDENRDHRIMEFENGAVWKIEKCPCSRIYLHLPVEKREDLDALSLPNPRDPERYKGLKEQAYYYKKRGYFVSAAIMGFFSGLHYFFRSFDDVMADLILDPDFSHRLLNMLAEFNLACAEELLDCGVHAITLCDDLGSADNLLISPKHYREYFLPWHRRLADLCHSKGAYMHLHSHGNINAIMDLIVESGVDIINPLDPEENMNLEGLKKKYGHRITLCGGISRKFSSMSPVELQDHIKSTIRCGAKGGGYIVMDASGVPDSMSKSEFNFYISTLKKYCIQKEKDIGS